jgi:phage/plasmid primase-like uncharacterized protein
MQTRKSISFGQFDRLVTKAKSVPIELIAERYRLHLRGRIEREGPCRICGGTDRFSINVKKQLWNCRGCQKGGDVIALVQHLDGADFRTAVQTVLGQAPSETCSKPGQFSGKAKQQTDDYERDQHRKANWLWQHRKPILDTPAERYLREVRGYRSLIPATLAYLAPSRPEHHPALISAFTVVEEIEPGVLATPRAVKAIHLTLLRPDGTDKAVVKPNKLVIASPLGHPITLAPPNDLLGLAITEGIEDGLSVYQATGLGVWAAGSAAYMPALADVVPRYVCAVTIFAHDDDAGHTNATALAQRLDERGFEVRI